MSVPIELEKNLKSKYVYKATSKRARPTALLSLVKAASPTTTRRPNIVNSGLSLDRRVDDLENSRPFVFFTLKYVLNILSESNLYTGNIQNFLGSLGNNISSC
ncbi:hypothetical protein V1478_004584 [Vespula squamosa]|uniref:Uncharacterized protein n=1 Tax=Vespula squamosa TaxID=30214 RepID=A0ABD2BGL8_VESSQ